MKTHRAPIFTRSLVVGRDGEQDFERGLRSRRRQLDGGLEVLRVASARLTRRATIVMAV